MSVSLLIRQQAGPPPTGRSSRLEREPDVRCEMRTLGFCPGPEERLIFDSAILGFVITTI